jgi:pyruvate formate lyase activating enzyme
LKDLESRKKFLDGIVISGGEPTLQPDLADFLRKVKKVCDLPIKLDTNGTNPDVLIELIKEKLVDFIALDIKAPKEKYSQIVGLPVEIEEIDRTIKVVKLAGMDYEFRTTFCPELTQSDVVRLVDWISEEGRVARFALQQYQRQIPTHKEAHTKEYVRETFDKIRTRFGVAVLRGL